MNLLSHIRIPSGHQPCLCESGERYRDCCRDAINAWDDRRLVEYEFLVNGHVVSSHEGTRRLGEPGVNVRARLYPPLERYLVRWVGPYDLPIGEDVNMRYRNWLDDHLAEEAPGEEVWQEWWAAFEQVAAREDIWVTEIGAQVVEEIYDRADPPRPDLWTTGVGATPNDPGLMLLNAFAHPVRREVLLLLAQQPANAARIAREAKITTPHAAYHVAELHKAGVIEPVPADRKPVRYRVLDHLRRDGIFRMLLAIARRNHTPRGFFVELGPYVDELYNEDLNRLARRMEDHRTPPALPGDQSATPSTALDDLVAVLGVRTVAYVCGLQTSQVEGVLAGVTRLDASAEARLQALHRTYRVLRRGGDTDNTIRRWFEGSNPHLEDEAPVTVLRGGAEDAAVLSAAADFAS